MSENKLTLKTLSYEESRTEYFSRKIKQLERELKWWSCQKPGKQYSERAIYESCSDVGAEISYMNDALNALNGGGEDGRPSEG